MNATPLLAAAAILLIGGAGERLSATLISTINPRAWNSGVNAPAPLTTEYFLKQGQQEWRNTDPTPLDSLFWLRDQETGHATTTFNGGGILTVESGENGMLAPANGRVVGIVGLLVAGFGGLLQCRLRRKSAALGA